MKRVLAEWRFWIAVVVVTLTTPGSRAAGPDRILYQGNLVGADNRPVPNGFYNMEFRIYDQENGGTLRFAQARPGVRLRDGFFAVEVGPFGDLFLVFEALWIELAVDFDVPNDGIQIDEVYTPRQALQSVPYAFAATQADEALTLGGAPRDQFVEIDAPLIETVGPNGSTNTLLAGVTGAPNHGSIGAFNATSAELATMQVLTDGSGGIGLSGPNGAIHAGIFTSSNLGAFEANNASGAPRAELFVAPDGSGALALTGPAGRVEVLALSSNNLGAVEIRGTDGVGRGVLFAGSDNAGTLGLAGPNGRTHVGLFTQGNLGAIELLNSSGNTRMFAEVHSSGTGIVSTLGNNGATNCLFSTPTGFPNNGLVSVHNSQGVAQAALFVDDQGRGVVVAGLKMFHAKHPKVAGARIVYSSLEGPEAGIYHRGTVDLVDGRAIILLPEHFAALADPKSITVQLTPVSLASLGVGIAGIEADRITIGELQGGRGSYPVQFLVQAARAEFADFRAVVPDEEFERTFLPAPTPSRPMEFAPDARPERAPHPPIARTEGARP